MDKIKDIITATLHTLDDEKICGILASLLELGVETEADLAYVVEDDLKDFLKPIQIRKLIAAFKGNSSSPEAAKPSHPAREVLLQEVNSSAVKNAQDKRTSCFAKENDLQSTSSIATAQNVSNTNSRNSRLELHLGDTNGYSPSYCSYSFPDNQAIIHTDNLEQQTSLISEPHTNNMNTKVNLLAGGSTMFLVPVNYLTAPQKQCHNLNSVSYSITPSVAPSPAKIVTLPQISSQVAKSTPGPSHKNSRMQLLKNIVEWEQMSPSLMKALESESVLKTEELQEIVTLIGRYILHEIEQPSEYEVDIIAKHIVQRFKSLSGKRLDSPDGCAHDFLYHKILSEIDHLKKKPASDGEQCINVIPSSESQTLGPESSISTNELLNFSADKTEECVKVKHDDQLEELDKNLCVDSHEVETLIAQSYSEVNSPESLKAKQSLLSELTKSFVPSSLVANNSDASNNFNSPSPKTSASSLSFRKIAPNGTLSYSAPPPSFKKIRYKRPLSQSKLSAVNMLELENIVNWDRIPLSIMTELQQGNVLDQKLRRAFVRLIADDILRVIPNPRRQEVYIVTRHCVKQYRSLEDRIGDSLVGNGCDSLSYQIMSRIENERRNMYPKEENIPKHRRMNVFSSYGCTDWSPRFPMDETVESLEAKRKALLELSKCFMIDSGEIESLIASTYFCQRRTINSGGTVSTMLSDWPLLFSDTGMMEHFKLLTGVNLKAQLRNALTSKGKEIFQFMCSTSNKNVQCCVQELNAIQKNESYSEIFALLMLLSSYFGENITSLIIKYEVNDPSDIGSLNVPLFPCLIAVGTSILMVDHFMLVCDGVVVNKVIKEDLSALSMLFASYFVLNYRYPKSNKGVLEFMQRCLAGINPPSGSRAVNGKNRVNRTLLRLCKEMNDLSGTESATAASI